MGIGGGEGGRMGAKSSNANEKVRNRSDRQENVILRARGFSLELNAVARGAAGL